MEPNKEMTRLKGGKDDGEKGKKRHRKATFGQDPCTSYMGPAKMPLYNVCLIIENKIGKCESVEEPLRIT